MHTDPGTTPPSPPRSRPFAGARRSIAMALLAIGLLVVGGSAVAMAADPTASPTPVATTAPVTDGTDTRTTAPANDGADTSGHPGRGDCPAKGGDGGTAPGGASGTTPDNDTTPDDTTTPEPSIDASDV